MIQYYSKADRRAIILLSTVALLCVLGVLLFGKQDTQQAQDAERKQDRQSKTVHNNSLAEASRLTDGTISTFDPNTADSLTLVATGLKPSQVRSFLRYRNAGAVFREPMDIARVYCLDDADIDQLLPKIRIAERFRKKRTKYPIIRGEDRDNRTATERPYTTDKQISTESDRSTYRSDKFSSPTKVDLNTADTTLLRRIPGIGSNIARWIVQRREKLGGFHSIEQLMEVKHVSADMLEWFELTTEVDHRDLSEMTFSQMASFPYIGYEKAKAISNYTRLYGPFKDSDALRSSGIFTDEELSLLLPYLKFK